MTIVFNIFFILCNCFPFAFGNSQIRVNLSGTDPIHLHNEGEVIVLTSLENYMDDKTKSWHWRFEGYEDFGFKFYLKTFNMSSINEFYVENSTDIFVNKRNAKEFHPYYNSDNYISIYLSEGKQSYGVFFIAYVTLVEKNFTIVHPCGYIPGHPVSYWLIDTWFWITAFNYHCTVNFTIPYNIEVDVHIFPLVIEKNADFLQYTYDNFTVKIEDTSSEKTVKNTFTLSSYLDGRNKTYFWEYIGDGSVPSYGTVIQFTEITCQCYTQVIPCTNKTTQGLMHIVEKRYCGNMKCNFTILPCDPVVETYLILQIWDCNFSIPIQQPDNLDVFRVFSNEQQIIEINNYNRMEYEFGVFLNSSNLNILEAITYQSTIAKCFAVSTVARKVPSVDFEVTLSTSRPYLILDSGTFTSAVIKSDIENDTFIIYSSREYGLPLFYDKSLTRRYISKNCFSDYNRYTCKLTGNKIVLFLPPYTFYYPVLSVHSINYRQNGCIFLNNTFITKSDENIPVTVVSSSDDYCIATLLINSNLLYDDYSIDNYAGAISYFYYTISYLWTNAKNENVKVFGGTDSLFFEFNSENASSFTTIGLFSTVYSIKVPKETTVYLHLTRQSRDFMPLYSTANPYDTSYIVHIFDPNYTSLISTPFYGMSKKTLPPFFVDKITYYFGNFTLKVSTLYYKMSIYESVTFLYPNEPDIRVNKTGDSFIFNKNNITFYYDTNQNSGFDNGAIFLLQIIDETNTDSDF